MKIVADINIPYLKGVLEPFTDVEYLAGNQISRGHLMDADALITRTRTKCNEDLLKGTKVKFIASATIGFDHIDTVWCENNGIAWTNAPGCNSGSVYQYVASALIVLSKKYGFDFKDRTLGILGVGNVGRQIVKLGECLGMQVILCDPPRSRTEGHCGYVSLDGIIRDCDIISCHVPLTMQGQDKTYHLINDQVLQKINPGTILINTSRGEVVDNIALKNELKSRRKLETAVMDVWENEPDIDTDLLDLVAIATPHIAGYSIDGKVNATTMVIQAVGKFFNLPLTRWTPEALPVPYSSELTINCNGKSMQDIISEPIEFSYKILKDDVSLRSSVYEFELLRSNYPIRREFNAYTIHLDHENIEIQKKLKYLGFKVK